MSLRKKSRLWWYLVSLVALIVLAIVGGWWWFHRSSPPDMVEVLSLNNKGVGLMEQFEYEAAAKVFEQVVAKAPDWLPGKINLGIALLNFQGANDARNKGAKSNQTRSLQLFEEVLARDPKNLHANYCKGIVLYYLNKLDAAQTYFQLVTEQDPHDPHAWYFLGMCNQDDRDERRKCLEKAANLDPNLRGAIYNLFLQLRDIDEARSEALFKRFNDLRDAGQMNEAELKYTRMGKYAEVIGRNPTAAATFSGPVPLFTRSDSFRVELAPGARWATAADFGTDAVADLRRAVRERFGGVIVVLDYDRDGKLDLFLLGAVVEGGQMRDLLLHNEGGGRFRDVTRAAGLADARPSLGCCVGDFNNDGYPDLIITGAGEQHLFRNKGGKSGPGFEEVTKAATLDTVKTICLGALWMDLDGDGDLDLVLCQYAKTPAEALATLAGKGSAKGPGLAVYLNAGEAPPAEQRKLAPLTTRFHRAEHAALPALGASTIGLMGSPLGHGPFFAASALIPGRTETVTGLPAIGHAVNLAASDLDRDQDLDLIALTDDAAPLLVLNDRLLKFHGVKLPASLGPARRWNGAVVFNSRKRDRSDLLLIGPEQAPLFLLNRKGGSERDMANWFEKGITNAPPLLQAQAVDLDRDGWTDLVGLTNERLPILLHNDGQRLVTLPDAFGVKAEFPKDLLAALVFDAQGDSSPALLLWSEKEGLQLKASSDNGNHALLVRVTGLRNEKENVRCNADGFGAWVVAQSGDHWTSVEQTTLAGGLGHSSQPLMLGLGKFSQAEVVRLRWPDGVWQAQMNLPTGELATLKQINRMPISCPLLFTWNGERYEFIGDFLGAGAMGEAGPDGFRPPRPEESIKIEASQMVPRDGRYVLKIAEPMDEITYLDRVELSVIDHPAAVHVYPDERFSFTDQQPTQDLLVFQDKQQIFPRRALDHKGRDVTTRLRRRDRDMVDQFALRSWLGFAEDHWVELDFGDRLAKFGPQDPLVLCLTGWSAYPYPEAIWAATQAGVPMQPPVLQRRTAAGQWETVVADLGIPAGLPRLMTCDVTGKLGGPSCVLRIRTNLEVYWDQIFVGPLLERVPAQAHGAPKHFRKHTLKVARATLGSRGCMLEYTAGRRQAPTYDYHRLESVPLASVSGKLTRFGEVSELLHDTDDRFVILGPGDEVTVEFAAAGLPPIPKGWQRSFVLRTWGYCNPCGLFSGNSGRVEPLPFQAMSNYPYGPREHYPQTAAHQDYIRRYLTREVGTGPR